MSYVFPLPAISALILLTKCEEFFPQFKQFSNSLNTSWVSCNSICPATIYLDTTIRSHRVRAQTQKTVLTSEANQKSSLIPIGYELGFPQAFLMINLLKLFIPENSLSIDYWFVIKSYDSGKVQGEEAWGLQCPPGVFTLPALLCLPTRKLFKSCL